MLSSMRAQTSTAECAESGWKRRSALLPLGVNIGNHNLGAIIYTDRKRLFFVHKLHTNPRVHQYGIYGTGTVRTVPGSVISTVVQYQGTWYRYTVP